MSALKNSYDGSQMEFYTWYGDDKNKTEEEKQEKYCPVLCDGISGSAPELRWFPDNHCPKLCPDGVTPENLLNPDDPCPAEIKECPGAFDCDGNPIMMASSKMKECPRPCESERHCTPDWQQDGLRYPTWQGVDGCDIYDESCEWEYDFCPQPCTDSDGSIIEECHEWTHCDQYDSNWNCEVWGETERHCYTYKTQQKWTWMDPPITDQEWNRDYRKGCPIICPALEGAGTGTGQGTGSGMTNYGWPPLFSCPVQCMDSHGKPIIEPLDDPDSSWSWSVTAWPEMWSMDEGKSIKLPDQEAKERNCPLVCEGGGHKELAYPNHWDGDQSRDMSFCPANQYFCPDPEKICPTYCRDGTVLYAWSKNNGERCADDHSDDD
jgi:hypothetical protein